MRSRERTFTVDIIQEMDGEGYYAMVPALPGCFSQGSTIEEARENIMEAISLHLRALKKSGELIPERETYQTTIQIAA